MGDIDLTGDVAHDFVKHLSTETKWQMYNDLKHEYADTIVLMGNSIEESLNEFAFHIFWQCQHSLLNRMDMPDAEIDKRIYGVES